MKFVFKPTIKLNIEKKHVLTLFILFAVAGIALVIADEAVIAEWVASEHPVWHDASNIKVEINDKFYDLQTAIDNDLILSEGDSGGTIPSGASFLRFNINKGSEEAYEKSCPATLIKTNQHGEEYYAKRTGNLILTGDLAIESGSKYNIRCTYGNETGIQANSITLDENYKIIAQGTEKHIKRYSVLNKPSYDGSDNFNFAIALVNDELNLRVTRDCSGCTDGFFCTTQENINNYCGDLVCPIYDAPKGLLQTARDIKTWQRISCTISEV